MRSPEDLRAEAERMREKYSGNPLPKHFPVIFGAVKLNIDGYTFSREKGRSPDAFIFTNDGEPLEEGRLYKVWRKACEDAGVKYTASAGFTS